LQNQHFLSKLDQNLIKNDLISNTREPNKQGSSITSILKA